MRLGLVELHAHDSDALRTLQSSRTDIAAAATRQAGSNANALWAEAADGDARAIGGDVSAGERLAREARTKLLAGHDTDEPTLAEIDTLLADVLDRKPAPDEARTMREEALTVFTRVYGADHPHTRAVAAQLDLARNR